MDMKRKALAIMAVVVLAIALCGCGSDSTANTIRPWEAGDEQAKAALNILTVDGFSAFAGFDVDESFQTMKMGIEYYKDGKLIKDENEGTFGLGADGEEAKASSGVAGFLFNYGKGTAGMSAAGSSCSTSDIELYDYKDKDEEGMSFASMTEPQKIADGEKIYIGIISSGSDTLDTSVMTDPESRKAMKGKSWLIYAVFTTEPIE